MNTDRACHCWFIQIARSDLSFEANRSVIIAARAFSKTFADSILIEVHPVVIILFYERVSRVGGIYRVSRLFQLRKNSRNISHAANILHVSFPKLLRQSMFSVFFLSFILLFAETFVTIHIFFLFYCAYIQTAYEIFCKKKKKKETFKESRLNETVSCSIFALN